MNIYSDFKQRVDMISSNVFNTGERSPKGLTPCSPSSKRKNIDFPLHSPMPTPANDCSRKDTTPLSPQPYYKHPKSIDLSSSEPNLQSIIRELSDRMAKISQKLGQHESILIKITENSLQSNKEQYKKGNQGRMDYHKVTEPIMDSVNRLRKDFEDFRAGNQVNRELEIKNQLFSELIRKSEDKMREEIQGVLRKMSEVNPKSISSFSDERLEEFEKVVRKIDKGLALNSGKIAGAYERIEAISSSIDGHMDLVNTQVNKAISKIVGFVNDKVSKPITENVDRLTKRLDEIQNDIKIASHSVSHFGNLKSSSLKSNRQMTKAEYRQTLNAYGSQIIISENTYYIDCQGYLLDREFYYLVDTSQERIRLDQRQIRMLMSERMLD